MEVSGQLHAPPAVHTVPIGQGLGGSQSRSGQCGIEKNLFSPAGNRTPPVQPVARGYTDSAIVYLKILFVTYHYTALNNLTVVGIGWERMRVPVAT
jgi:hypothetical protein